MNGFDLVLCYECGKVHFYGPAGEKGGLQLGAGGFQACQQAVLRHSLRWPDWLEQDGRYYHPSGTSFEFPPDCHPHAGRDVLHAEWSRSGIRYNLSVAPTAGRRADTGDHLPLQSLAAGDNTLFWAALTHGSGFSGYLTDGESRVYFSILGEAPFEDYLEILETVRFGSRPQAPDL